MPGPIMVPGDVRVRTDKRLDEYVTPFGEAVSAAFGRAVEELPTNAFGRINELLEATYGAGPEVLPSPATAGLMPGDPMLGGPQARQRPDSPTVAAETARQRVSDEGVKLTIPDDGIPERALDILIARKREEVKRQDAISRASADAATQAGLFGSAFAASLLDPVNVGLAFIPVVGPTRYALMLERAGGVLSRTGVRAGVGAIEGAAGAALIEPVIYTAAQQQQADYTLVDSLLNIAFGTAFGGGLHVAGGLAGDAWRSARGLTPAGRLMEAASPETREAALRTSVSQMVTGRAVEVEPVIHADPAVMARDWRPAAARLDDELERIRASDMTRAPKALTEADLDRIGVESDRALYADVLEAVRFLKEESRRLDQEKPRDLSTFVQRAGGIREGGEAAGELAAMEAQRRPGLVNNRTGRSFDDLALDAWQEGYLRDRPNADQRPTMQEFIDALREDLRGERKHYKAGADQTAERERVARIDSELEDMGIVWRGQDEDSIVSQLKEILPRAPLVEPGRVLRDTIRLGDDADGVLVADFDALARADERQAEIAKPREVEDIEAETAEIVKDTQARADQLGDERLSARVKEELASYDELAEQAETFSRALRAAGLCGLRRGI